MTKHDVNPKVIEAEEDLLIDYQFLLRELISEKKISNSELAAKAGISKARLSQVLSSDANPTIKTFARLFYALGEKLTIASVALDEHALVTDQSNIPVNKEHIISDDIQSWDFERTLSAAASIDDAQMVAVVRNTVASEASNDNYAPSRIQFMDSDFLLVEPEEELEVA